MTGTPLGVGIVGAGNVSAAYGRNMALFPGLRLVGWASRRPEAARAQAAAHGGRAMTVDGLLGCPEVDLVLNLTTPDAHFAISHAALTAGRHVFTEKPLAATLAEGRRLVEEAERRGLHLGCAPDTFLGAGGRLARRMVDAGAVGRVVAGSAFMMSRGAESWHPDPAFLYRHGAGPVLDIGPYYLTMLVNLLGPVTRVQALSATAFAERVVSAPGPNHGRRIAVETPTTVLALLLFASGTPVTLAMSWDVHRHGHPGIELYGTDGSMRLPDPNTFGGIVEHTLAGGAWQAAESAGMAWGQPNWRAAAWPADRPDVANYRGLGLAEMAAALTRGTPHRSSGRLALHALEVMDAIGRAAATGSKVDVPSVERPAVLDEHEAARLGSLG